MSRSRGGALRLRSKPVSGNESRGTEPNDVSSTLPFGLDRGASYLEDADIEEIVSPFQKSNGSTKGQEVTLSVDLVRISDGFCLEWM